MGLTECGLVAMLPAGLDADNLGLVKLSRSVCGMLRLAASTCGKALLYLAMREQEQKQHQFHPTVQAQR